MDFQERIQDIQTEINRIKNMLGQANNELSKLRGEVGNTQGVSDEEFREAWEFWRCTDDSEKLIEVFGYSTLAYISDNMSLSGFVNKYKEYKQKKEKEYKEIKVGDEVISICEGKGVVTRIYDVGFYVVWYDGSCGKQEKEDLKKTGNHYDIKSMLNQLKE